MRHCCGAPRGIGCSCRTRTSPCIPRILLAVYLFVAAAERRYTVLFSAAAVLPARASLRTLDALRRWNIPPASHCRLYLAHALSSYGGRSFCAHACSAAYQRAYPRLPVTLYCIAARSRVPLHTAGLWYLRFRGNHSSCEATAARQNTAALPAATFHRTLFCSLLRLYCAVPLARYSGTPRSGDVRSIRAAHPRTLHHVNHREISYGRRSYRL